MQFKLLKKSETRFDQVCFFYLKYYFFYKNSEIINIISPFRDFEVIFFECKMS